MLVSLAEQKGKNVPNILLAPDRHGEPTVALLERAQPLPHAPPVDHLVGLVPADERQREHRGIGGGEVRGLAGPAPEPSRRVLHAPHRARQRLAVAGHVLAEEGQAAQGPVEDPGAARVGGHELAGQPAHLPVQEPGVALAVQAGQAVGVGPAAQLLAREEGEALVDRLALEHGALRADGVLYRRVGRVHGRYHRGGPAG